MNRYIDADKLALHLSDYALQESPNWGANGYGNQDAYDAINECIKAIDDQPTADVVEVGKWCDMHEYIIEMQADENGHNEFFRIIKLPVIYSDDELKMKKEYIAKAILYGADMIGGDAK